MSFVKQTEDLTTVLDFIRFGITAAEQANLYYGHGTDNAVDDIYALVLETLDLPWNCTDLDLEKSLHPAEKQKLAERLEKRILQNIPVPYLTHTAYFCGMNFYVDERVLIPRSPIAELIQGQFAPWIDPEKVTRILDMCTGSGCIALACCEYFPQAVVDGVDLSADALAVADINRERQQKQTQLHLIQSDCFDQLPEAKYDIIVSNPPYVAHADMQTLPKEYLHEPRMALEANENGLALINRILHQAPSFLNAWGILVVEVGLSEALLQQTYPELPFVWLEFEHGGEGVFLLTAQDLRNNFGRSS